MKFAYALLAFALPIAAFAADAPAPVVAQPLRMAHASGTIQQQDGSDDSPHHLTDLCSFEGDVPVFPDPSKILNQRLKQFIKVCDVNFGGKHMRVQLSANAFEMDASKDKAGNAVPAKKALEVMLFVFESGTGKMFYTQYTSATSEDLAVRTMGTTIAPVLYSGVKMPKGSLVFTAHFNMTENQ